MNWPLVIVVVLIAAAGLILLVVMTRRRGLKGAALERIRSAWRHVLEESNPVLRVVEADKVLDEALRLLGFTGSLGDKLKAAGPRLKNLNDIWSAHKLRNKLMHELNVQSNTGEVDRAIRIYERTLKNLGMK